MITIWPRVISEVHRIAMYHCEYADFLRIDNHIKLANDLYRYAFLYESAAAQLAESLSYSDVDTEILYRSAIDILLSRTDGRSYKRIRNAIRKVKCRHAKQN